MKFISFNCHWLQNGQSVWLCGDCKLKTTGLTVVVGVAVVTMEVVIADANVGSGRSVAQSDSAHAAAEASDVIKQAQTLNDHGRTTT